MADHLSRLRTEDIQIETIRETFPDEQLYMLHSSTRPWYADLVNYLVTKEFNNSMLNSIEYSLVHTNFFEFHEMAVKQMIVQEKIWK